MGFIVMTQSTMQPPLVRRIWEHRTVAAAMYVGPYEKTGEAIEKIMAWLDAQGYEATGPVLERYLDQNPAAVKPESLKTEIWVPCRKK
jgi:effector-binding domain-containing protein